MLVVVAAVAWAAAPAQSQQASTCPPGQVGNAPYCETPVKCPPGQVGNQPYCAVLPPACGKLPAKLSLLRATISRTNRNISILAPITGLASGQVQIQLHAAGRRSTFSAPVDSANRRIRVTRNVTSSQARLGTGILTLTYPGDADTRPQVVRLRSARTPARLRLVRPVVTSTGRLLAQGTVTSLARGVVRTQLQYVNRLNGQTTTLEFQAQIRNGSWSLNVQLTPAIFQQILLRCGSLHSYTLFTGYIQRRIRGEMRSFQVLPGV